MALTSALCCTVSFGYRRRLVESRVERVFLTRSDTNMDSLGVFLPVCRKFAVAVPSRTVCFAMAARYLDLGFWPMLFLMCLCVAPAL